MESINGENGIKVIIQNGLKWIKFSTSTVNIKAQGVLKVAEWCS